MADGDEGLGFWLPSEFFDDFLADKVNLDKNQSTESDSEFCFPTEFPYDFGTKSDEHIQKRTVMSTSPQSTLTSMGSDVGPGSGSPNAVPSPPTTPSGPKNDAVGDLIYLAAGQVARLKMNGNCVFGPTKYNGLSGPPKTANPSVIHNVYLQQQKQGCGVWYREQAVHEMRSGAAARMGPVQQNSARIVGSGPKAVLLGGAAVKRECAGTGVFLPRRYGNNLCNAYSSDSRKRPGYLAASTPNSDVHSCNNLDNMDGIPHSQPHFEPKFSQTLVSEYDLLMARRNVIMLQHQRRLLIQGSSPMNRGVYLPQEWTY